MNEYTEFVTMLNKVYRTRSAELTLYPSELLDRWDGFVGGCEDGYGFCVSEYNEDISLRRQIETLISVEELRRFADFYGFVKQIEAIDDRLRALFLPGVSRSYPSEEWWMRGVLRYAGPEYAHDMKSLYGIEVAVVDG